MLRDIEPAQADQRGQTDKPFDPCRIDECFGTSSDPSDQVSILVLLLLSLAASWCAAILVQIRICQEKMSYQNGVRDVFGQRSQHRQSGVWLVLAVRASFNAAILQLRQAQ